MQFVHFIVAAIFGRISAQRNISLEGARYNGQDEITVFHVVNGIIRCQRSEVFEDSIKLKMKMIKSGIHPSCLLKKDEIRKAAIYTRCLWERQYEFEYADLLSCMVMNYQAAILHKQQHAAASLALNFSVIESLLKEIFYFYGLVGGYEAKSYATKKHTVPKISKTDFGKMRIHPLIKKLHSGLLIDDYLFGRIEDARKKRNSLMHKGQRISPKESADCQTIVRDLWSFLIDMPFEIIAGWSYRR